MISFPKNLQQKGMSFIELIVVVGVTGIVLFGVSKQIITSNTAMDSMTGDANNLGFIVTLRKKIRMNYLYRTQIDIALGAGKYDGVEYDPAIDPPIMTLRTRDKNNLDLISATRYETVCTTHLPSVPIPPLPSSFCSSRHGTCSGRFNIKETHFPDESDTSNQIVTNHPTLVKNKPTMATALCIYEADNDKIRMRFAYAKRSSLSKQIQWEIEDFEVWEDVGKNTIEFLR